MKITKMIFRDKVFCYSWIFFTVSFFQPSPLIAEPVDKTLIHSFVDSSVWILPAEQWEAGLDGNHILQIPVLKSFMQNWIQHYDANNLLGIELQYPGGEDGELWVQELADWLVSMGLPSNNISMVAGSGTVDKIKLILLPLK